MTVVEILKCNLQSVGANTAMSLLLTATSNILGVFSVPFMVAALLASTSTVTFDPVLMVLKLATTVLAPLAVGAALRSFRQVSSLTFCETAVLHPRTNTASSACVTLSAFKRVAWQDSAGQSREWVDS
jgi:predicted Na+-dependent transporter